MELRVAQLAEQDEIWSLIDRCRTALLAAGIEQWDGVYPHQRGVRADLAAGTLFVLGPPGEIVGCVTLDEAQDPSYATLSWTTDDRALVVHRLCIDPMAQGRGHGQRIMTAVEALAAERGYPSIRLDAYSGNPRAAALYRTRGYREVGQLYFPRRTLPFFIFERRVE